MKSLTRAYVGQIVNSMQSSQTGSPIKWSQDTAVSVMGTGELAKSLGGLQRLCFSSSPPDRGDLLQQQREREQFIRQSPSRIPREFEEDPLSAVPERGMWTGIVKERGYSPHPKSRANGGSRGKQQQLKLGDFSDIDDIISGDD
jgi:hypothetical protein